MPLWSSSFLFGELEREVLISQHISGKGAVASIRSKIPGWQCDLEFRRVSRWLEPRRRRGQVGRSAWEPRRLSGNSIADAARHKAIDGRHAWFALTHVNSLPPRS